MVVAVCSHDAHGDRESRCLPDERGEEGAIVPLAGGHCHGYGELRVCAGDDVKFVPVDPAASARLLRLGSV